MDQGGFSRQSDDLTKYQSNLCRWCILPYQLRDMQYCNATARYRQAKELLQRCPVYDGNRVEEEKKEGAMKIILDRHRADAFE